MDTFNPENVWLAFDSETDEEPSHEANIFRGGPSAFTVEHCHTGVGLITTEHFDTLAQAEAWLTEAGFQDFSS